MLRGASRPALADNRGVIRKRARQRDTLLLAAGELRRIVVGATGEADLLKQRLGIGVARYIEPTIRNQVAGQEILDGV